MTAKLRGRRWSEADDLWLRRAWGKRDLAVIAVWLQRTAPAVAERARRLKLKRETMTLRAFARHAGVPISKVYWAIKQRAPELQRVRRSNTRQQEHGAHFALTPEQQDSLLSLIRAHPHGRLLSLEGKKTPRGLWGVGIKPEKCRECGSAERPHYSKGYCKPCAVRVWKWLDRSRKNPARRSRGAPPKSLMYQPKE